MINKIIASYILFACLIAIALKLGGVDGTIHLGNYLKSYLVSSNLELQNYKIVIPQIKPFVPIGEGEVFELNNAWDYLKFAYYTAISNMNLVGLVNGIINFMNMFITVLNTLVQTIQLIFIFLKNIIVMKDSIINA